MMTGEPILTPEDHRIWVAWQRQALAHAKTNLHRTRIDRAKAVVLQVAQTHPSAYLTWSAGKDSTAMVHFVRVACGIDAAAMSVKDDLDYPGEEDYLRRWADAWDVRLSIVRPSFFLQSWLADHASEVSALEDLHSRSAEFSQAAFYRPIADYAESRGLPGVYLGLRSEESHGRRMNRATRGPQYTKRGGETVCTPIVDWKGIDVYAYLFTHGIDPLPVYRCVALHDSPDRVRKSWWLPGAHSRKGGVVWLRTYYPSLYAKLCRLLPDASFGV